MSIRTFQFLALNLAMGVSAVTALAEDYVHFEGRHTRSIQLSADGERLYALNTPDARLSVFDVTNGSNPAPLLIAEIPVGLEPVSLAERNASEVWVVNELSDSVSIVDLDRKVAIDHLDVPDEPADIVFADGKAYVTCARNRKVRVFNAVTRQFLTDIAVESLFPRAMTVSADGSTIYVANCMSGNKTTILPADVAPAPPPPTNPALPTAPHTGQIVLDSHSSIPYSVLDNDVAIIDTTTTTISGYLEGAGTILFDVALQPGTGDLWVANTEALNLIAFEPNLRGHFVDNRVSQFDLSTPIPTHFDLNAGVDYNTLPNPAAQATSIAQPTAIVFEGDGNHLWVAGFGSDIVAKVRASDGAIIERVYVGPALGQGEIAKPREKRGPRSLAFDEANTRLFVLNRISNSITTIDTTSASVTAEVPAGSFDPTPIEVREGRGFLYDARLSGNGTNSCASCHIDGDRDGIAWDLGDPGGVMTYIDGESRVVHDLQGNDSPPTVVQRGMHPMKGPKVTQTLRGMITKPILVLDVQHPSGVSTRDPLFHWRGDKESLDEFNATFDNLMGGSQVPQSDFDLFKAYLDSVKHHPNPYRNLDRSLPSDIEGGDPDDGRNNFLNHGLSHCVVCHPVPSGTDQNIDDIDNSSTIDFLKTPHLLLSYQKHNTFSKFATTNLSGFGFNHDGAGGTLPLPHFYFLSTMNIPQLIDTRAFVLGFDSISDGTAPVIGHNLMVTSANASAQSTNDTLDILEANADPSLAAFNQYWNDVIATGRIDGRNCAVRFEASTGNYLFDTEAEPPHTRAQLLARVQSTGDILHFTGVPAGQGVRFGGDRNGNGILNGDEPLPVLDIFRELNEVKLAWPEDTVDWFVQEGNLLDNEDWKPFNQIQSLSGGMREIGNANADETGFFRLHRTW